MNQTRIVILGGGFGGLSVARRLLKSSFVWSHAAMTLVDQHPESTYTPWLHEVAGGSTARGACGDSDIALESVRGLRYRRGVVDRVDPVNRHVILADGSSIHFDILVCAFGSISNDFGIPGVSAFALDLKRTTDALKIRNRFASMIDHARRSKEPQRLVVVGTGANGTEFAAECATTINHLVKKGVLRKGIVDIALLGSTTEPLLMLSPRQRAKAVRRLENIGVSLHMNTALTGAQAESITVRSMRDGVPIGESRAMSAAMTVVALGVKVSDVVMNLAFEKTDRGRLRTDAAMRVLHQTAIFALGDCAAVDDRAPEQQTAQAAVAQSKIVARNIIALMKQRPLAHFKKRNRWDIILTLGEGYALGTVLGVPVSGYTIAILRRAIDAKYFFLVLPWWEACTRMIRGFFTYGKAHIIHEAPKLDGKRRR
jgi:NADH dehydrogenase